MRRPPGTSWQIAGTTILTAWVLAACGLEAVGTAAAQDGNVVDAAGQTPAGSTATAERRIAATIESGEITQIERIVVTPPSRVAEGLTVYRVVVRLQNGELREFTEPTPGELKVGDRVQVVNSGSEEST